jgi:hypothetical protein
MRNFEKSSRAIRVFYRLVLPACIFILLLIVSQTMERSFFRASQGLDLFTRIWIIFSFCLLYVRLSDLERYMFRTYGIKIDHSQDQALSLNWRNILLGSLLGVVSIPFSWWIIQVFLPNFSGVSWLLAVLHGLLLSFPMLIWRNRLVM